MLRRQGASSPRRATRWPSAGKWCEVVSEQRERSARKATAHKVGHEGHGAVCAGLAVQAEPVWPAVREALSQLEHHLAAARVSVVACGCVTPAHRPVGLPRPAQASLRPPPVRAAPGGASGFDVDGRRGAWRERATPRHTHSPPQRRKRCPVPRRGAASSVVGRGTLQLHV